MNGLCNVTSGLCSPFSSSYIRATSSVNNFSFSETPAFHTSSASSSGWVLRVSFNITGFFGIVTSFISLVQQEYSTADILTKGVSNTLFSVVNSSSLSVVIVQMCWDEQCLPFGNRRSISSGAGHMRVLMEVYCPTYGLADLSTAEILSTSFQTNLAHHLSLLASSENLGNWSVLISLPKVTNLGTGRTIQQQQPPFKYNESSTPVAEVESAGSLTDLSAIIIPVSIALAAAAFFGILIGLFRMVPFLRLRSNLKIVPEATGSVNNYAGMVTSSDFLPSFVSVPESDEQLHESRIAWDNQSVKSTSDSSETPMPSLDPGVSAPVAENTNQQNYSCISPQNIVTSISPTDDIFDEAPVVSNYIHTERHGFASDHSSGTKSRLKHARIKLAGLQRKLDKFMDEAGQSTAIQPWIPGSSGLDNLSSSIATKSSLKSPDQDLSAELEPINSRSRAGMTGLVVSPDLSHSPFHVQHDLLLPGSPHTEGTPRRIQMSELRQPQFDLFSPIAHQRLTVPNMNRLARLIHTVADPAQRPASEVDDNSHFQLFTPPAAQRSQLLFQRVRNVPTPPSSSSPDSVWPPP